MHLGRQVIIVSWWVNRLKCRHHLHNVGELADQIMVMHSEFSVAVAYISR